MALGWDDAAMLGGGALAGALQGQPEQHLGNLHLVNGGQAALWRQLFGQYNSGAGDFGFGQAAKMANSQIGHGLANRGLSQQGGYADQLRAGAYYDAAGQDMNNRRSYAMQLLGTPLQVAQTAGANYLPTSFSQGGDTARQDANYSLRFSRNAAAGRALDPRSIWRR